MTHQLQSIVQDSQTDLVQRNRLCGSVKMNRIGDKGCLNHTTWTAEMVEAKLVSAAWTLRKIPDKDDGFFCVKTVVWPAYKISYNPFYKLSKSHAQGRVGMPTPREIDLYMDILAWLEMLPDLNDRQIVFWAVWHLNGVARQSFSERMPWKKIGASLYPLSLSRVQLWRRHKAGLTLISQVLSKRKIIY